MITTNKFFIKEGLDLYLTYYVDSNKVYYITSDKFREEYTLWVDSKGEPKQTKHKDEDPTNLYKYCK